MFVTFFDTCMVSLAAMFVWRISPYWIFFPWLTIACLDGTYLSSALTKVPQGAWFTLTLAAVLASSFILWRFGKEQQWAAEASDRFPTSHFIKSQEDGRLQLVDRYGGGVMSRIKGLGIFFDKAGETTPIVFSQFALKLVAAPEVMVFFHLRPLETPTVAPENRYTASRLAIPNCYRLIVRHGFMDEVMTPDLASLIYQQIRDFVARGGGSHAPRSHANGPDFAHEEELRRRIVAALPAETEMTNVTTGRPATTTVNVAEENSEAKTTPEQGSSTTPSNAFEKDENAKATPSHLTKIDIELAKLEEAYAHQVLYIIGKEEMRVKTNSRIVRKILLHMFLWVRDNTRTKIAYLKVPSDRVIQVGFVKDV